MNQTQYNALKVGDIIKVIANGSSHNYIIGTLYRVKYAPSTHGTVVAETLDGKWSGNNLTAATIELAWRTREEHADFLDAEVTTMKQKIKELTEQSKKLRLYKDDKDELAHLIANAFKTDGSVEAIRKILDSATLLNAVK